MEFKVYQKELELQSRGWIPTFHDISREVVEIVKMSGVKNGTVTIASHHTTCSVMIQECSHDIDSFDLEYLQHDHDIMQAGARLPRASVPPPGQSMRSFPVIGEPGDFTSMNTDGHLRSVFRHSETMTIKDGVLDGEFAHIYLSTGIRFAPVKTGQRDSDGNCEDVGDRKWRDGQVIDTLHKFSPEEKAYDPRYDFQPGQDLK